MPKSALPDYFKDEQTGDWNFWPFKYLKPSLTAFGPRCTEWWAKWRAVPKILIRFGPGPDRYESDEEAQPYSYLSAIQYWKAWGIQLQWPLFFAAHYYLDEVAMWHDRAGEKRVLYIRLGARRNADRFYDFPSAYVGIHFN